jgi:glucose-6-phosphate isomerase
VEGKGLPLPSQVVSPGILEGAYRRELQNLTASNALARLWARDSSLWPAEKYRTESVKSNLRWLDLPEQLGPLLAPVAARAAQIEPAGFEDVVFVTMGDSNLAAESILGLPHAKLAKRFFLLNTIDADSVRAFEGTLRLDKTLFVFANKSGTHIETHSLLLYFLERLRARGIRSPARHFVTLTEENSYLGGLARAYKFLDSFFDPPGIHGRYSSLIHFNFFLAALCRMDPVELQARTKLMRDACGPAAPREANPAVSPAAFLAAAEREGLNRLVFFSPDNLKPVSRRIGYLVGASTCKKGRGIIPIFGRSSCGLEMFQRGYAVVILQIAGEKNAELSKSQKALRQAGVPLLSVELTGPEELAVELFKWEIATALSSSLLDVDPFHDPDIREGRARAAQVLEETTAKRQSSPPTARVIEGEVELYAEGQTRQQISSLNMSEALRTFFGLRHKTGYIALLPFMSSRSHRRQSSAEFVNVLNPRLGSPYSSLPARAIFMPLVKCTKVALRKDSSSC